MYLCDRSKTLKQMKRHHLFLLIFLTVASISASATCLYDGGKGTTPPNPKTAPETTKDIETVPIIISCENSDVVPLVPHHLFSFLVVNVNTYSNGQMEFIYGFGLGNGQIEVGNRGSGEVYSGTVTPDTDRLIIDMGFRVGTWDIGIRVQNGQGKPVMYYGNFMYTGRPFFSF